MYSLGGNTTRLALVSKRSCIVAPNIPHSSTADTSPRLNEQNLETKGGREEGRFLVSSMRLECVVCLCVCVCVAN